MEQTQRVREKRKGHLPQDVLSGGPPAVGLPHPCISLDVVSYESVTVREETTSENLCATEQPLCSGMKTTAVSLRFAYILILSLSDSYITRVEQMLLFFHLNSRGLRWWCMSLVFALS